jgi:two-component system response regulator AdeR
MATKICIIEDDHSIATMYQFKLEQQHYKVRIAYDGAAGLELVRSFQPELILLDLKMPVMSGEDMLQELRSDSAGSNVKVIVLTNISRDEAPQKLRLLNVERYVVKAHHTPAQVVTIVKEVLSSPTKKTV